MLGLLQTQIIRVVIIEDERRIREGLEALINGTDGYSCTAVFRCMEDALQRLWPEPPDVVLVDIGLPGMSGLDGLRLLRERYPDSALVMLTVYEDDERVFDALCAGACGYLLKRTPPARLLEDLREAKLGGAPISPDVARRVISIFRTVRPPKHAEYDLTPHEVRLLKLLVEGHNYKSAAAELGVTYHTVAFHIQNIYEKLQVHSKSEAVAKALRDRLIS